MDYRMDDTRDNSSYLLGLLGGLAIGALAMYLFDPEQGRRRRALLTDQLYSFRVRSRKSLEATQRDLSNRAQGMVAETRGAMEDMKEALSEAGGARGTLH